MIGGLNLIFLFPFLTEDSHFVNGTELIWLVNRINHAIEFCMNKLIGLNCGLRCN